MDYKMQIMLIVATIISFFILTKSVKKGKLRTDYALGWILASLCLIIVGIFPQIIYVISDSLGFMSPSNLVFMLIIFLLIILVYVLFSKVSMLEEKQKNLIQEMALLTKKLDEGEK